MHSVRIQSGATERIESLITVAGSPATGLGDVLLAIRRVVDGYFLDFDDGAFKGSGWAEREHVMTEVSAATAPGWYQYTWDTTGQDEGQYSATVTSASGDNVPQVGELHVGEYVDHLDSDISALLAVLAEVRGLVHGDHCLDQTTYDTCLAKKLLRSARMRLYSNPLSVGTDADVIATFLIAATYVNDDELDTFQVVKQ